MLFRSDRKSTRLNSSHTIISYAVFCLKKKRKGMTGSVWGGRFEGAWDECKRGLFLSVPSPHHVNPSHYTLCSTSTSGMLFFFLTIRRPPRSTPFPYTTLSR